MEVFMERIRPTSRRFGNNGKPAEACLWTIEIHKRVMALSFRDCHTKIRHVDAHATLNEGVVVQVMGELSNNMQPMRKFMQTFVLAPEGTVANKFYVHNDVFRYQDEVFGDSDSEPPEGERTPIFLNVS
nr:ras GTPase-activating protein-binding protein 1-like [Pseudochaenichthys georgianus]